MVGNDVVQLAGDAESVESNRLPSGHLALALELRGSFFEL